MDAIIKEAVLTNAEPAKRFFAAAVNHQALAKIMQTERQDAADRMIDSHD